LRKAEKAITSQESSIKAVPDSSWFMVAKIDTEEALSTMRRETFLIIALFLGILAGSVAVVGQFWLSNEKARYRTLYEAEQGLRRLEERYRVTLMSIGDGVIAADPSGCVAMLNPVAERLTGWSQDEARGKPIGEVFHIINESTHLPVENPVDKVLKEGVMVVIIPFLWQETAPNNLLPIPEPLSETRRA